MQNKTVSNYFNLNPDLPGLSADQSELYRIQYAALAIRPILFVFIAIGFGIIYVLGLTGLLDSTEPRLLVLGGIALLAAVFHLPIYGLMHNRKLEAAAISLLIINSLASATPVFFWQGIVLVPILLTIIPIIVFATQRGLRISLKLGSIFFGAFFAFLIYYLDQILNYERMSVGSNLTQMAALSIYIIILFAMFALLLFNTQVNYRTISSRLVTIFTFVALLSATTTLIIAALATLYNDRQRVFLELNAISSVRTHDVEVALDSLVRDANQTLTDSVVDQKIQYLLANDPGAQKYQEYLDAVQAFISTVLTQNSRYQEIFLIHENGKVLTSTQGLNSGQQFSSFNFYQNALLGINYAVEYNFPTSFDQSSILVIRPINKDGFFRGAIVIRSNFDSIKQILASKTGTGETVETYMVGLSKGEMIPLTNIRQNVNFLNTKPAEQALMFSQNQGSGIWNNYVGKSVLGSFVRIPAIKTVLIAEIEQQEVTQKTINISLTNSIIGLFTLLLAFVIVFITSRTISLPIVDLAEKASNLSKGDFSTRMVVNRRDEIGTLATSFNSMANELQGLIQTLEKKVEDRTQDLQKQANYLRVAAEVARDATTAQDLDELLNRAVLLILGRFSFYHTGIFLIDERKEYAVLRASPTKAGQEMLARKHRLKVGQVGIVGNVAATGISRIALDTGLDSSYFNNPLLPHTRSEMALPLKVNDELIGVLDVQSEKPEAFSQDDIGILQIMADQLALAIQRMLLAKKQEENLRELEGAYQSFTLSSWKSFSQTANLKKGYSFDGMHFSRIENLPVENHQSLMTGKSVIIPSQSQTDLSGSTLAVPLNLRDRVIGVLTIGFNSDVIPQETIDLVEDTAGRLATALENARLYTETQLVAEREQAISQISSNISKALDVDGILRSMVEELGNKLMGTKIEVQVTANENGALN